MEQDMQSFKRTLDLIEQLSQSHRPTGSTELARNTGFSMSTVSRLLSTLLDRGYVKKSKDDGKYSIGPKLIALISCYIGSLELQTEARPYLSSRDHFPRSSSIPRSATGFWRYTPSTLPGPEALREELRRIRD